MPKFVKKPLPIEAIQYEGRVTPDLTKFLGAKYGVDVHLMPTNEGNVLIVNTLEGDMTARPWDWIIKGVQGELYPCKPDIFEMTYERIDNG